MAAYIGRRLLQLVPVLLLVSVVSFSLLFVLPGDAALAILGEEQARDRELYERVRAELGLDRPLPLQYLDWAGRVLSGDLGSSTRMRLPVLDLLRGHLFPTLQLTLMAMIFALLVAVPVGIASAAKPNSRTDVIGTVFAMTGASVPNFWLGLLLILAFAVRLRWLPPSGYVAPTHDILGNLRLMLLPTVTLGAAVTALLLRQVRSAMLEVLRKEYITTARSKGLRARAVLLRHALRNALIPVVTVVGLETGHLIGGAVVTEAIFSVPGVGSLAASSIFTRDFPVLQGVVLLTAIAVVIANLATDLLYAWLDPRIRYR